MTPYPVDISQLPSYVSGMNAPSTFSRTAAIFKSNRSQAIRIPKEFEFPEGLTRVTIRKVGDDLVLSPAVKSWSEFFALGPSPDFPERDQPPVQEREFW